jgi:hypothetical protein
LENEFLVFSITVIFRLRKIGCFWKTNTLYTIDEWWRVMLSEAEMRKKFDDGFNFPPLQIRLEPGDSRLQRDDDDVLDATFAVSADDRTFRFAAEFKSRSTPRIFEESLASLRRAAQRRQMLPMLVVPYLRESQLEELQERKLSGIDLSGNGVVTIPGKLLVYRTGAPNKYPDSAPTKYAYRGATSLVARAFLCRAVYQSLADIETEIEARGGSVVISTISKALKRMESDLIVDRTQAGIRLRQPDKLLKQLAESYKSPRISKTMTLRLNGPRGNPPGEGLPRKPSIEDLFLTKEPMVLSGTSSIENYAVMGRQEWPIIYTQNIDKLVRMWGNSVEPTSRFVDFELCETDDPTVYFDLRVRQNLRYASPVQVFLECSAGDKREQETAVRVRDLILRELTE